MGKPYSRELDALGETYSWAMQLPIPDLEMAIQELRSHPLIAVGSGGSLAAATFASAAHEAHAGWLSRPASPVDLANIKNLRNSGVLFLSAGGKNVDIRSAFSVALRSEPPVIGVICFSPGSPLSKQAKESPSVKLIERALPCGKDGFLSVNSLLALSILILRAYSCRGAAAFPSSLSQFMSADEGLDSWVSTLKHQSRELWDKRFIILVHGADLKSAAVDMESKFSEAALGAVQVTDIRNFAHGRHYWLAKHPRDSAVVFLVSDSDLKAAQRTQHLLPRDLTSTILQVSGTGLEASIRALIWVFYLAKLAGDAKGIDPGRPGVPDFGRRIYSLNVWPSTKKSEQMGRRGVAIDRKLAASGAFPSQEMRSRWEQAYDSFLDTITDRPFQGLICDYDGTLIDHCDRFDSIREPIAFHLNRLLKAGWGLGIATGRGGSVRDALLRAIEVQFHSGVYVGYHNSGEVAALGQDPLSSPLTGTHRSLAAAKKLLEQSEVVTSLSTMHVSHNQIGMRANQGVDVTTLYRAVLDAIARTLQNGVQCLLSTHSVDVIPAKQSKEALLKQLSSLASRDCLAIGDLGQWPGNDFALLQTPFSLSSNRVSTALDSCWNLAPAGVSNAQATLFYLNSVELTRDGFVLRKSHLLGGATCK